MTEGEGAIPAGASRNSTDRRPWFFALTLVLLGLDHLSKYLVRATLAENESAPVPWPGVFELKLTYNTGIAFGLFRDAGIFLTPIAIVIVIAAGVYAWRHKSAPVSSHLAMALLAAGALGNLLDRIIHGKVTDMFWIRAINFPVFNVADACITVAAAILILHWAREIVERPHSKAHDDPESSESET